MFKGKRAKKQIEEFKEDFPTLDLPENTINRLLNNEYEFTNDDVENDVSDSSEKYKNVNYKGRGFKALEDAVNYIHTDRFKKLEKIEQDEYLSWLNK